MKAKQVVILGFLCIAGVAAATGAAAAYYWNRATALPTWYTSTTSDNNLAESLSTSSGLLEGKLATGEGVRYGSDNQVEITLNEAELNQLILEGLAQTRTTSQLLQVAEGINASINGNQLEAGVVINPSGLPLQDLSPEAQQTLQQALTNIPGLSDRNLYIGIEGNPRLENGRVVLGEDTRLRVGNVRLSASEVARLTGYDVAQLTEQLNIALPQAGVTLDGIEFVNGEAILRGTTQ